MSKRTSRLLVAAVAATALAVGVGVAVAAGGLGFDNDQQAFLDNAAKRLGVTPAELKAALQGAYDDRLDAAVAAGKITKEQADAMKKRSQEGVLPPFGGGPRGDFGHGGPGGGSGFHGEASLATAATYLGMTEAELQTQLRSGKTLAQVAAAKDKSVDGLKKALAAATKAKLDAAVKAGTLTKAKADELEKRMTEHLDDLVAGTGGPRGHRHGDGPGWGGPRPGDGQRPAALVPIIPAGSPA